MLAEGRGVSCIWNGRLYQQALQNRDALRRYWKWVTSAGNGAISKLRMNSPNAGSLGTYSRFNTTLLNDSSRLRYLRTQTSTRAHRNNQGFIHLIFRSRATNLPANQSEDWAAATDPNPGNGRITDPDRRYEFQPFCPPEEPCERRRMRPTGRLLSSLITRMSGEASHNGATLAGTASPGYSPKVVALQQLAISPATCPASKELCPQR